MKTLDPTKHLLGYGRRDPVTGMLHGHIRWPDGTAPTPAGCRWCGHEQRSHGQMWLPGRGFHKWEQPTSAQIFARMQARRAARKAVCRCPDPSELRQPFAPVVDPWKCEADDCRMADHLLRQLLAPLSFAQAMDVLDGGGRR